MNAPNDLLRQAIHEAGCTYAELAKDVRTVAAEGLPAGAPRPRTNSSAVAHWVAGTHPYAGTAAWLTEALSRRLGRPLLPEELGFAPAGPAVPGAREVPGTPGAEPGGEGPVAALVRLGRADLEQGPGLVGGPYSVAAAALPLDRAADVAGRGRTVVRGGGNAAGDGEIRAAQDMLEMFTLIDERYGGRHGRPAVVQYLTSDVAAFCRARFRTERQHREMLGVAASVAYLAGWKAHDAGEQGLAQRYYLQSYRLAREAEDPQHEAFVLRILAHHGMEAGRYAHVLDLMDAAVARVAGRADRASEALHAGTRARALAVSGRSREAAAESARAVRLATGADDAELPYWAALWGPASACVRNHVAKGAAHLGEFAIAEQHFTRAVWSTSGTECRRIAGLSLAYTGTTQCRQGQVERACDTWGRALDLMDGVRSGRVVAAVHGMREDLAATRRRGSRVALDFDERVRAWLAVTGAASGERLAASGRQ